MNLMRGIATFVLMVGLSACASAHMFRPDVMNGVDTNFDVATWHSRPNDMIGRKVQLGGRIVRTDSKDDGVVIEAAYLPIVEHPAYGPTDPGKPTNEFLIRYRGKIEPSALTTGNRLIVVGTTQTAVTDDTGRHVASVAARCLHIWKTVGREISDFPFSSGGGYRPLEEHTYCAPGQ
jgi:starvation-inducible outer membrane lipoprotein